MVFGVLHLVCFELFPFLKSIKIYLTFLERNGNENVGFWWNFLLEFLPIQQRRQFWLYGLAFHFAV
jgi:hypothetical protein